MSYYRAPPIEEVLRPKFSVAFAIVGLVGVVFPSLPIVILNILLGLNLEGLHHLFRAIAMVYFLAGSLVTLQISLDHPAQPKHVLAVILGSGVGIPLIYFLLYWAIPIPLMFSTFAVLFPFTLGFTGSAKGLLGSIFYLITLFGLGSYFATSPSVSTPPASVWIGFVILFSTGLGLPLFFLGFYWAEIVPMRSQG